MKKKRKRKPVSEETRQKMRDAYRARMTKVMDWKLKEAKKEIDAFDSQIDVRQQIADFLGLSR